MDSGEGLSQRMAQRAVAVHDVVAELGKCPLVERLGDMVKMSASISEVLTR